MFEKKLAETFQKIFAVKKVSYDAVPEGTNPDQVREQECLFIRVENAPCTFKDKLQLAKVTGTAVLVGRADKVPFGFFQKAIMQADPDLTKDLFFFELESNSQQFRDIVHRSFSFIYLFSSQYDPAVGNITSVTLNVEEQST